MRMPFLVTFLDENSAAEYFYSRLASMYTIDASLPFLDPLCICMPFSFKKKKFFCSFFF